MMDCLCSTSPNDEELLRHALDGDVLSVDVKEHLQICTICQQRLNQYTYTNSFLLRHLYRSDCPNTTTLSHYCAGMLSIDEVMCVASHLETCPLCMHEVAETRRELAQFDVVPEKSPPLTPRAALKRIIASLVPWQPHLVTRSSTTSHTSPSWPRQYQANDINLSLHLSRDSNNDLLLLGLLSSSNATECIEEFEGIKVELHCTQQLHIGLAEITENSVYNDTVQYPVLTTLVDDLGNIVFKAVRAGNYLMIVYLPDLEMVIEGLHIER